MRCRIYAFLIVLEVIFLTSLLGGCYFSNAFREPAHQDNRQLARVFELTDLALWTGARYMRHLSQADLFSPFQDSMCALEHFPEGVLAPPPLLIRASETLTPAEPLSATTANTETKNEPAS